MQTKKVDELAISALESHLIKALRQFTDKELLALLAMEKLKTPADRSFFRLEELDETAGVDNLTISEYESITKFIRLIGREAMDLADRLSPTQQHELNQRVIEKILGKKKVKR